MAKKEEQAGGGSGGKLPEPKGMVSKISITPSRKINLGNYETLECQAGIEITFEQPLPLGDKRIEEALDEARVMVQKEFRKQFDALGKKKK